MTTYTCLIIEDSDIEGAALIYQLQQIGFFEPTVCRNWDDALNAMRTKSFDLIFLDIQLTEKFGLTLLQTFTNLPPVIVVTAYPEYAAEAYDIDSIVDYVVKPIDNIRLLKAINRALNNRFAENSIVDKDFAFFKVARKVMRFDYDSIDYISAYGVYSKLFCKNQINLVNEPIATLEKTLPKAQFRRIHKSYIINFRKITGFDHKSFFVGSEQIPIGISYRPQLEGLFKLFENSN